MGRLGLMAGALSQGLEGTLAGANTGLLQGEQIRHQREQEAMHQEYLRLSQQQQLNSLAQQAFANAMAQQNLGLHERQLGATINQHEWQRQHGAAELGLKAATEARHQELLPYETRYKQASSDWMTQRPDLYRDRNEITRERNEMMRERHQWMAQQADQRLNLAERRLEEYIKRGGTTVSRDDRLRLSAIQTRLRSLRQQFAAASQYGQYGMPRPPGLPSIEELTAQIHAAEAEIPQMITDPDAGVGGMAPGAGGPQKPLTLDEALKLLKGL